MNAIRRKRLQEIIDQLEALRESVDELKEEEEGYRNNMPENLQGSERYEKASDVCDNLEDAVDGLEEVIGCIASAIE